jgi:hypothetical protein
MCACIFAQIGSSVLQSAETGEDDLVFVYNELHSRGLLKAYGSVTMDVVPCLDKDMSVAKLESVTGMNMRALAPGRDNFWLYAGAAICLVEYAVSQMSGIDPLQVIYRLIIACMSGYRRALLFTTCFRRQYIFK